jgi:hypothetical protein
MKIPLIMLDTLYLKTAARYLKTAPSKLIKLLALCTCVLLAHFTWAQEINYGQIANGTYGNDYFGFSIKMPSGWTIQSQAEQARIMDEGRDLITQGDEDLIKAMHESGQNSLNLFAFLKYELGAPVAFNPSLAAIAERVDHEPSIHSGADYLVHVKEVLNASAVQYTFPGEIYKTDLGGLQVDVLATSVKFAGAEIHQNYYAVKIKDYVLSLVGSYSNLQESRELKKALSSVKFADIELGQ